MSAPQLIPRRPPPDRTRHSPSRTLQAIVIDDLDDRLDSYTSKKFKYAHRAVAAPRTLGNAATKPLAGRQLILAHLLGREVTSKSPKAKPWPKAAATTAGPTTVHVIADSDEDREIKIDLKRAESSRRAKGLQRPAHKIAASSATHAAPDPASEPCGPCTARGLECDKREPCGPCKERKTEAACLFGEDCRADDLPATLPPLASPFALKEKSREIITIEDSQSEAEASGSSPLAKTSAALLFQAKYRTGKTSLKIKKLLQTPKPMPSTKAVKDPMLSLSAIKGGKRTNESRIQEVLRKTKPKRAAASFAKAMITSQYRLKRNGYKNAVPHFGPPKRTSDREDAKTQFAAWASKQELNDRLRWVECQWYDCDAVLGSVSNLIKHTQLNHCHPIDKTRWPYVCLYRACLQDERMGDPLRFESDVGLQEHVIAKHILNRRYCPMQGCAATFGSLDEARRHLDHHGPRAEPRQLFRDSSRSERKVLELVEPPGLDLRKVPVGQKFTPWVVSDPGTVQYIRDHPQAYALQGKEGILRRHGGSLLQRNAQHDDLALEEQESVFLEPMRCEGAPDDDWDVDLPEDCRPGCQYDEAPTWFVGPRFRPADEILLHPFRSSHGFEPARPRLVERPSMRLLEEAYAKGEQQPDPREPKWETVIPIPVVSTAAATAASSSSAAARRTYRAAREEPPWQGWRLVPLREQVLQIEISQEGT